MIDTDNPSVNVNGRADGSPLYKRERARVNEWVGLHYYDSGDSEESSDEYLGKLNKSLIFFNLKK